VVLACAGKQLGRFDVIGSIGYGIRVTGNPMRYDSDFEAPARQIKSSTGLCMLQVGSKCRWYKHWPRSEDAQLNGFRQR
jgi:hypothetical protein